MCAAELGDCGPNHTSIPTSPTGTLRFHAAKASLLLSKKWLPFKWVIGCLVIGEWRRSQAGLWRSGLQWKTADSWQLDAYQWIFREESGRFVFSWWHTVRCAPNTGWKVTLHVATSHFKNSRTSIIILSISIVSVALALEEVVIFTTGVSFGAKILVVDNFRAANYHEKRRFTLIFARKWKETHQ